MGIVQKGRCSTNLVAFVALLSVASSGRPALGQTTPKIEKLGPDSYRLVLAVPEGTTLKDAMGLLQPTFSNLCPRRGYRSHTDVSEGHGPRAATATLECLDMPALAIPPPPNEAHARGSVYSVTGDTIEVAISPNVRAIIKLPAETPIFLGSAPTTRDRLKPGVNVDVDEVHVLGRGLVPARVTINPS